MGTGRYKLYAKVKGRDEFYGNTHALKLALVNCAIVGEGASIRDGQIGSNQSAVVYRNEGDLTLPRLVHLIPKDLEDACLRAIAIEQQQYEWAQSAGLLMS